MTDHEQTFPVDETTLTMLRAACQINPDSGHTELMSFLDMGARVKTTTESSDEFGDDGTPVYLVEYEEGFEPWSPQGVIPALVDEILRLRSALVKLAHYGKCRQDREAARAAAEKNA